MRLGGVSQWRSTKRWHGSCHCRAGTRPALSTGGGLSHHPTGDEIRQISEPYPSAEPPSVHHCCVHARGNIIAFAQVMGRFDYRLFVYRLDSGMLTEITSGFSLENVVAEMAVSQQAVLFMINDPDMEFMMTLSPLSTLYRYDITTGQVNSLTGNRANTGSCSGSTRQLYLPWPRILNE